MELFKEVRKYHPYFISSGGGVTASGGDPIKQTPAVTALFTLCKRAKIHTTLDTSGATTLSSEVDRLLDQTNLVLLDIKQMNATRHKKLTGIDNYQTLAFAQHLADKNIPTWIRYVVVPGVTDSEEDCRALSLFIETLPNVEKIELLPFHKMGEFKWEELNAHYDLTEVQSPTVEDMNRVIGYFSELTIPVCTARKE